ncbi:MAG: ATP-dependent zinc protease [Spirulinaceae cyanobacterium]
MKSSQSSEQLPVIGGREYLALPDFKISSIEAKIDLTTRSSVLHAFELEYFEQDTMSAIRFKIYPQQNDSQTVVQATARVIKKQEVRDAEGNVQLSPIIQTWVSLAGKEWPIELILTDCDIDNFRLALGRKALRRRFSVDPSLSFVKSQLAP